MNTIHNGSPNQTFEPPSHLMPSMSRTPSQTSASTTSTTSSGIHTPSSALSSTSDVSSSERKTPCYGQLGVRQIVEGGFLPDEEVVVEKARTPRVLSGSLNNAVQRVKTYAKRRLSGPRSLSLRRRKHQETNNDTSCVDPDETQNDDDSSIEEIAFASVSTPKPKQGNDEYNVAKLANMSSVSLMAVHGSPTPAFPEEMDHLLQPLSRRRAFMYATARVATFVPWCIVLGGAILLSPDHLPLLASPMNNFLPQVPSHGVQRFAYWAECAYYHVFIFVAALVAIAMCVPRVGVSLIVATIIGTIWRWYGFKMDDESRGVRLGEDDWQSCYLVATKVYLKEECRLVVPSLELEQAASMGAGARNARFE